MNGKAIKRLRYVARRIAENPAHFRDLIKELKKDYKRLPFHHRRRISNRTPILSHRLANMRHRQLIGLKSR